MIRNLAARLGLSPGQLALAWLLAQGPDVVPVPGSRRPERIAEKAAAAGLRLGPADLERLGSAAPLRLGGGPAVVRGPGHDEGPAPARSRRRADPEVRRILKAAPPARS